MAPSSTAFVCAREPSTYTDVVAMTPTKRQRHFTHHGGCGDVSAVVLNGTTYYNT